MSMPRPRRSNFTSPAAAQSSLSHWSTERPSMRAHSIGQNSSSGRSAITMPPEWMPRWRGKSITSAASSSASGGIDGARVWGGGPSSGIPSRARFCSVRSNRRSYRVTLRIGVRDRPIRWSADASSGLCSATRSPKASGPAAQRSTHLPSASAWPGATPAALAISRSAERGRYVITLATCAARSRPYRSYTYWITSSRRWCSMSRSMSGGPSRSGDRNRSNSKPRSTASALVTPSA